MAGSSDESEAWRRSAREARAALYGVGVAKACRCSQELREFGYDSEALTGSAQSRGTQIKKRRDPCGPRRVNVPIGRHPLCRPWRLHQAPIGLPSLLPDDDRGRACREAGARPLVVRMLDVHEERRQIRRVCETGDFAAVRADQEALHLARDLVHVVHRIGAEDAPSRWCPCPHRSAPTGGPFGSTRMPSGLENVSPTMLPFRFAAAMDGSPASSRISP